MKKKPALRREIDLLYELGALRHIDRTWKQFAGPRVANLAEHHFRMAWIALAIAAHEKGADAGKVARLALLHDVSESRTGDVNYLTRQYVKRDVEAAVLDMFADTSFEKEAPALFDEYEKRESLESRIVKDADNLDVELELKELAVQGHKLGEPWEQHRRKNVYPRLYTRTAKLMWDEICLRSDPQDWHNLSPRNRHRGGDWSRKKSGRP
ncbi:MAG: HD domain-containing protein [Patescibacteria group bacterium]|nr:HD domain-containing protein [Patescibacteria group bacterium]